MKGKGLRKSVTCCMESENNLVTHRSAALGEAEGLADVLVDSARTLFSGGLLCADLESLAGRLRQDCRRLVERGGAATPAIAILGKVGTGKSWLARCFLPEADADNPRLRAQLKSGQQTRRLTWIGVEAPSLTGDGGEQFLRVKKEQMLDLGRSYEVGDTPGFTDVLEAGDKLSDIALNSAAIKLLVTTEEQLRAGEVTQFVKRMNGALILPVIRFEPRQASDEKPPMPNDSTIGDARRQIENWRIAAPATRILDAIFMPHARIYGDQRAAEKLVQGRLQEALQPLLGDTELLRLAVEGQVRERTNVARREAASLLNEFGQRVGSFIDKLEKRSQTIPERLLSELIGDDLLLHSGIRQRFRADWLDRTPAICFPYRSFAGLLSLTAGAWDKVIFSLAGSVPSLALSFFQSIKNWRDSAQFESRLDSSLARRVELLLAAELAQDLRAIHRAILVSARSAGAASAGIAVMAGAARVTGLDEVEIASRQIMRDQLSLQRANGARLLGMLGLLSFWGLLAGPLLALYRGYLVAWWNHIALGHATITEFPTPPLPLLTSCLLVSAVPTFLLALIGHAWCCSTGRVNRTVQAIKLEHGIMMQRHLRQGSLEMVLTDDRLEAARELLKMIKAR